MNVSTSDLFDLPSPGSFISGHSLLQNPFSPTTTHQPAPTPNGDASSGIPSTSAVTLENTLPIATVVSDTSPSSNQDQVWKLEADWSAESWTEIIADFRQATRISQPAKPHFAGQAGEPCKYSCSLCTKTYKRRSDATAHVAEVHLEMAKFFCQHCKFKQFRRWPYERHVRNMHKNVASVGNGRIAKGGRPSK